MAPYFKEKGTIKTSSNLVLNELFGNKNKIFGAMQSKEFAR